MRQFFFMLFVKPALFILLGFNVRHLDRLTAQGAHLIAANHNSHLDALALMSLFRFQDIPKIKLVAAKDYWCRTPFLEWFSLNIIGIIPIDRKREEKSDPIEPVMRALDAGYTVIIFPEGSRGEPEIRQPVKYGIAKILEARPHITVTPVFMYGLGKSLPREEALLVPFVCEVNVGELLFWNGDRSQFIFFMEESFSQLAQEIAPRPWQ
jgi:1-acyl-sn-glycerol-3-phosphate acyltransferase